MRQTPYFIAALLAVCLVFGAAAAFAQSADPKPVTIKEVWDLPANTPVVVEGNIIKDLGPGKYALAQGSEEIGVKISDAVWGGDPTGPKDLVVIHGKTVKDGRMMEIEAGRVERK